MNIKKALNFKAFLKIYCGRWDLNPPFEAENLVKWGFPALDNLKRT